MARLESFIAIFRMNATNDPVSPQWLASRIYQAISRPPSTSLWHRAVRKLFRIIRAAWLKVGDPPVVFFAAGFGELVVPFSHDLGLATAYYPDYSLNLGRLASVIHKKYPHFAAIDVGANVGDSVRLVRNNGCGQVLCIEGAREFLPYLRANVRHDTAVEIQPTFVDTANISRSRLKAARGSLHLEPDARGEVISGEQLSRILEQHPFFTSSRLFKLDTDGLDLEIIAGNVKWVTAAKPVIFFEYLPYFFRKHGTKPEVFFELLASAGYNAGVVYDNFGRYLAAFSSGSDGDVRELIGRFERDHDGYYADIAVFHDVDAELATQLAALEFGLNNGGGEGLKNGPDSRSRPERP